MRPLVPAISAQRLVLLMSVASAWAVMGLGGHKMALPAQCGLSFGHWLDWGWDGVQLLLLLNPPEHLLLSWAVMLVAMMVPLLWKPMQGLGWRGARGCAVYFALWLMVGAGIMTLAVALRLLPGVPLAYGLLLAGLWQVTPVKRQALALCHVRNGIDGWRGAVRFTLGCMGSCWAFMLLPFLVAPDAHFWVMLASAAALLTERWLITSGRPAVGPVAGPSPALLPRR